MASNFSEDLLKKKKNFFYINITIYIKLKELSMKLVELLLL